MTIARDASSEKDVLYEFAVGTERPDPKRLDEFVRAHPAYADALTTLAIELVIEHAADAEPAASHELDPKAEAILSRGISHLQNRLFGIRTAQAASASEKVRPQARDLFAELSREQMRGIISKLEVSPLFMRRLRDCEIRVDTMTPGFIHEVADVMEEPQADVSHYFARSSARLSAHVLYKSSVTPSTGKQLTFEEAVRDSNLTPEQQARLLAM